MKRIGMIVSDFNDHITHELLNGAKSRCNELGITDDYISVFHVPGAVEIPLTAKLLAKSNQYNAIIALGCVIRGETSHYDYVCDQVSQGCQRVMLDYDIPVIFGVLTTENDEQAKNRIGGTEGHKGKEAADAAVHMMKIVDTILHQD